MGAARAPWPRAGVAPDVLDPPEDAFFFPQSCSGEIDASGVGCDSASDGDAPRSRFFFFFHQTHISGARAGETGGGKGGGAARL